MNHYTPTIGIKETGRNARAFVKANQQLFWSVLKPLLPYMLILNLVDAIITGLFYTNPKDGFHLGALVAMYFFSFLLISWHRVVIEGPDRFTPANPLKPKGTELSFIFAPMGVMMVYIIAVSIISGAFFFIGKGLMIFTVFLGLIGFIYGLLRISFYLPGKAIGADMTMKKAWTMTNGYIWKLFAANLCASWKLILINILYTMIMMALAGFAAAYVFGGIGILFMLFIFILQLPILIYLSPMMGALGVTVLSNYYLIAKQNQAAPTSPQVT